MIPKLLKHAGRIFGYAYDNVFNDNLRLLMFAGPEVMGLINTFGLTFYVDRMNLNTIHAQTYCRPSPTTAV